MVHIGNSIRDLLHEKKIKQAALAKLMGINPQRVSSILQQQSITTDVMQDIMLHTQITAAEIFQEKPMSGALLDVYKQLADCQAKVISLQEKLHSKPAGTSAK